MSATSQCSPLLSLLLHLLLPPNQSYHHQQQQHTSSRSGFEDGSSVTGWDKKPLKNRDTVDFPLAGRLIEAARRGSMTVTHAMMGFGKDPSA